jgi:hypothetical protein
MNAHSNSLASTAPTPIVDGFSDGRDPTSSPIRGTSFRFKDGGYFAFADRMDIHNRTFAVFDKLSGWQKLEKDCPAEYLMRQLGEPRPAQPHVDEKDWPLDLNGKPQHPWRWTQYLHLLDTATGEVLTFSTNTIGGRIAIDALTDQVDFMRRVRPGAIPVVALESKDMPTQFGGTKPRPHFGICGWREAGGAVEAPQQIAGPTMADVEPPTTEEIFNDEIGF